MSAIIVLDVGIENDVLLQVYTCYKWVLCSWLRSQSTHQLKTVNLNPK